MEEGKIQKSVFVFAMRVVFSLHVEWWGVGVEN